MASPGEGQYRLNLEEKSGGIARELSVPAHGARGSPLPPECLRCFANISVVERINKVTNVPRLSPVPLNAAGIVGDLQGRDPPGVKTYSTSICGVDLAGGSKGEMKSKDRNSLVQEKRRGSKERDSSCVYSRTSTKWP